jgi:uncharacterized protein (DUF4415 family)
MSEAEKIVRYTRKPLTEEQIKRIDALANLPDESIDFSDAPEADPADFKNAQRGLMYRALKQQTTLRIDADVLDWFKQKAPGGKGYQTEINRVLREYVARQAKKAG